MYAQPCLAGVHEFLRLNSGPHDVECLHSWTRASLESDKYALKLAVRTLHELTIPKKKVIDLSTLSESDIWLVISICGEKVKIVKVKTESLESILAKGGYKGRFLHMDV